MLPKVTILDLGNYKFSHGMTLIELLMVVLICSIVLSGAMLSLRNNTPYIEDITSFCQKLQHAQKAALYGSILIKAHIDRETGVSFLQYVGENQWEEHHDPLLNPRAWRSPPTIINWCNHSTSTTESVEIFFYPDGSTQDFCIQCIWSHEDDKIYQITGNSIGYIYSEY